MRNSDAPGNTAVVPRPWLIVSGQTVGGVLFAVPATTKEQPPPASRFSVSYTDQDVHRDADYNGSIQGELLCHHLRVIDTDRALKPLGAAKPDLMGRVEVALLRVFKMTPNSTP
jgi:mRNA-degrading endonuclease toxin of MazEF toxin-antitoxin module